ncbi:MAG: TPM domain-containing protein [Polyangiaceae bacterium]|nr:TPM domain-containing protein [Polyangiaceae bacterium]
MMLWFGRKKNSTWVDRELIQQAIAQAELQTSGEIRVSLAPYFWGNVKRAADRAFVRLGMTKTQDRNGVLFFVVPSRRAFAVLGDEGIHAHVGQEFWEALAAILTEHFKRGEFTAGLVAAISAAGAQLSHHFPRKAVTDKNELPNAVDG